MLQNQQFVLKRDVPYSLFGIPIKSNLNEIILKAFPQVKGILHNAHPRKGIVLDLEPLPNIFVYENEFLVLLVSILSNALEAVPGDGTVTIQTYRMGTTAVLHIHFPGVYDSPQGETEGCYGQPIHSNMKNFQGSMNITVERSRSRIEFSFPIPELCEV